MMQVLGADLWRVKQQVARFLPASAVVHGTLEVGLTYGLLDRLGTRVYVPHDSSPTSLVAITPAFSTKRVQSLSVFWDTAREDPIEIASCLSQLPGLDWTSTTYISAGPTDIIDTLEEAVRVGLLGVDMEMKKEPTSRLYCLSDYIPPLTVPEGLKLDKLRTEDIPIITEKWPYKWTESPESLAILLSCLPSCGLRWTGEQAGVTQGKEEGRLLRESREDNNPEVGEKHFEARKICHIQSRTAHGKTAMNQDQDRTLVQKISEEENWPAGKLVSWIYTYNNGMLGNGFVHPRLRGLNLIHLMIYFQARDNNLFRYTLICRENIASNAASRKARMVDAGNILGSVIVPKGKTFEFM